MNDKCNVGTYWIVWTIVMNEMKGLIAIDLCLNPFNEVKSQLLGKPSSQH